MRATFDLLINILVRKATVVYILPNDYGSFALQPVGGPSCRSISSTTTASDFAFLLLRLTKLTVSGRRQGINKFEDGAVHRLHHQLGEQERHPVYRQA